jgi:hypothetical protein
MKHLLSTVLYFAFFNLFGQSTYNPSPQTLTVNYEKVACAARADNECLLVKFSGKKEFEMFSETIEGFNYEAGYTYTISVRQELKQPPIAANESIFKYVLIKIISKKPINQQINTASNTDITKKIFEINYETVPCEIGDKKCLLVKEKGKKEFEIFNATIAGFNYQAGYSYEIEVKPTTDGNYYLVNELSKKFVKQINNNNTLSSTNTGKIIQPTKIQTIAPLDGKWYLRKMKENEGSSFVMDDNTIWININTFNDKIDGFGACNKFGAVVKSDLNTTFEINKFTPDYSYCGVKKIEDLFFDLLQQADRFEIKNGNLILSKQWKYLLAFTLNPNNKEEISTTYVPENIIKKDVTTYATDAPLKQDEAPKTNYNNTTTTSSSSTTITTTTTPVITQPVQTNTNSSSAETTTNPEIEEKNKVIEELRRQIAAQQQQVETKKQEQLKTQQDAEIAVLKKQVEEKRLKEEQQQKEEQAKQAQLKSQQDAEIAALKRQVEEKKIKEEQQQKEEQAKQAQLKSQKDAEIAALKKQVEEKRIKDTQQQKEIQIKDQKDAEIAELKKQLEEKSQKATPPISASKTTIQNIKDDNANDEVISKNRASNEYQITTFTKNTSDNIPDPEFTNRPYYLDGKNLERLERVEGIFVKKQKGIYRGTDEFVNAMKQESQIQFEKGNIPRIFIKLNSDKIDPYDIINLEVAKIKKDRRTFIYRSQRLSGKVKDVTGNLISLEFKKIRDSLYEILIEEDLEQGEYGFMPIQTESTSQSYTNSVKMNCFGVVDTK